MQIPNMAINLLSEHLMTMNLNITYDIHKLCIHYPVFCIQFHTDSQQDIATLDTHLKTNHVIYIFDMNGGGIIGSGLPSSPHFRFLSSELRLPFFNLLGQLPILSLRKRQFFESSVFIFKIFTFLQSYFFATANLKASGKPGNLLPHESIVNRKY